MPWVLRPLSTAARLGVIVALSSVLAGCDAFVGNTPKPTRAGFGGVTSELARRGIQIDSVTSGDPGCDDERLAPTAVRIGASGLDQPEPVVLYLYSFRNQDSYGRLRGAIDGCAQSYVTDPSGYESVDAVPYVIAGQGPWAPRFETAIRDALDEATPNG